MAELDRLNNRHWMASNIKKHASAVVWVVWLCGCVGRLAVFSLTSSILSFSNWTCVQLSNRHFTFYGV